MEISENVQKALAGMLTVSHDVRECDEHEPPRYGMRAQDIARPGDIHITLTGYLSQEEAIAFNVPRHECCRIHRPKGGTSLTPID